MSVENRDKDILKRILDYCEQAVTAHADFETSRERFSQSSTYQNAICMCVLQIGELVNRLSDDFKRENCKIPWRSIRGMRNYVAHEYGSIDLDVVWHVSTSSIDELRTFCVDYINTTD